MTKYLTQKNIAIISICIIGIFVRVYNLGLDSLRLDESQSIWQATHSIEYIIDYMSKNVHVPMYNFLLHYIIRLFGTDIVVLRLTAAIPGFLATVYLYLLAKELFGTKTGLTAFLFAAILPIWVWYSREIRMYGFLLLFTCSSHYYFIKYIEGKSFKSLVLYTLSNVFGIFTHYFFALTLISQAFYYVAFFRDKAKVSKLLYLTLSALVTALLFLPWLLTVINSPETGKFGPSLQPPSGSDVLSTYFQFMFGYQSEEVAKNIASFWPLFMLVLLVYIRNKLTKHFTFLMVCILLPTAILFMGSHMYKPMYLTRYLIPVIPMFTIFIAYSISLLGKKAQNIATYVISIILLVSLSTQLYSNNNPYKENYKDAVSYVLKNADQRDVVAVAPVYTIYPVNYYYDNPKS